MRSPELGALLRRVAADVVVHNDILQFPEPGRSARHPRHQRHRHAPAPGGVRRRCRTCARWSSAAPRRSTAPSRTPPPSSPRTWRADYPLRTRFQRDVGELERLFDTFARRHPEVDLHDAALPARHRRARSTRRSRGSSGSRSSRPSWASTRGCSSCTRTTPSRRCSRRCTTPCAVAVNVAAPGTVSLTRMLRRLGRAVAADRRTRCSAQSPGGSLVPVACSSPTTWSLPALRPRGGHQEDGEEVGFTPAYTTAEAVERVANALQGGAAASGPATAPAQAEAEAGVR